MIKKVIRKLNNWEPTRELLMIPIIYCRDKLLDFKNSSFINTERKKLIKYKNIHRGERCFIIGNGPSLTPEDLDLIKDEVTFASNRIYDIYPNTEWRPTYYAVQDLYVLKEITEEIEELETGAKQRLIIANRPQLMCEKMKTNPKNNFFYLDTCLSENRYIPFRSNISKIISNGRTITYAMIQMAYYMGFKEIYLLGIDHNYGKFIDDDGELDTEVHAQSHFKGARAYKHLYACNVDSKKDLLFVSTMAYQSAEDFSRENGFRIYNATRGGKLEIFDRVKLEDIIV